MTGCARAGDKYIAEIQKCDDTYFVSSQSVMSTVDAIDAITERTDCYTSIVYSIIEKHYKQNSTQMRQNYTNYIDSVGEMTGLIERPDTCYPTCGTNVSINSAQARFEAAKKYLDTLLKIVYQ